MKRLLPILLCFLMSTIAIGQEVDRVLIQGKITAPSGEDIEGIHIFNISSSKGTVTNEDGAFEIAVAENDRLEITAIQFTGFTAIVDKGVVDNEKVSIYLNPTINKLDTVVIRPYDLSGNIVVDVGRIDTFAVPNDFDVSYEEMEFDYEFAPDGQTAIQGNYAEDALNNGGLQNGFNFVSLLGLAANAILGSKKKKSVKQELVEKDRVSNSLRARYTNEDLLSLFNISNENANDFIYFVEESEFPVSYLKVENELVMLAYLKEQTKKYKKQLGE